jgi:hypothetical protein
MACWGRNKTVQREPRAVLFRSPTPQLDSRRTSVLHGAQRGSKFTSLSKLDNHPLAAAASIISIGFKSYAFSVTGS